MGLLVGALAVSVKLVPLEQHPQAFPSGEKFEYSNSNYMLLATVVERVTKKSFGSFLPRLCRCRRTSVICSCAVNVASCEIAET